MSTSDEPPMVAKVIAVICLIIGIFGLVAIISLFSCATWTGNGVPWCAEYVWYKGRIPQP